MVMAWFEFNPYEWAVGPLSLGQFIVLMLYILEIGW